MKTTHKGFCWRWWGYVGVRGYGVACIDGVHQPAHRAMYERALGKVPEGRELHHDCENRWCVNPAHLEALTHRQHMRRHQVKTHCVRGHDLAVHGYVRADRPGQRNCRLCAREHDRKRRQR